MSGSITHPNLNGLGGLGLILPPLFVMMEVYFSCKFCQFLKYLCDSLYGNWKFPDVISIVVA